MVDAVSRCPDRKPLENRIAEEAKAGGNALDRLTSARRDGRKRYE
jgi:hypothetical protein